MIPFGSKTVTLIKRQETLTNGSKTVTSFKTYILSNCYWKAAKTLNKSENEGKLNGSVTCLIPEESTAVIPCVGDYLVLGSFASVSQSFNTLKEFLDKKGGIQITAVTDNALDGYPLPHYKCIGA